MSRPVAIMADLCGPKIRIGQIENNAMPLNAGDTVTEAANEGNDAVQSSVSFALSANVESLTLSGTAAIDGTGNNVAHPTWGSVGQDLLRLSPAAYGDGIASPSGADRPNARLVSNLLATSPAGGVTNDRDFTALPITTVSAALSYQTQWTQEVRYAGNLSPKLNVVVGAFYFHQNLDSDPSFKQEQGAAAARVLLVRFATSITQRRSRQPLRRTRSL